MDSAALRTHTTTLADDLGWLEQHCESRPALAERTSELRVAAALVRNVVAPSIEGQPDVPLHVVVVGGAGTGKSTVVNFLCGDIGAEANPQAGFTRHPVAYAAAAGTAAWPSHAGFLGPLRRLEQPAPSSLDDDVFQIRRVPNASGPLLESCIVWDCPDMTTWAATGYVPRLLEVAALADVVIYVASDERYNDAVPTQFLRLLLQVGKPVIACLTKVKPEHAEETVRHFNQEVLADLPQGRVTTLVIPYLPADVLADPVHRAAEYRVPLLNQVLVLSEPASAARRRTVQSALHFLQSASPRLLSVARDDVAALEKWTALVRKGQKDFDDRYRREYLTGEKFRLFDDALVRLIELLEFPGAGRAISSLLYVVRTPYRLLKGVVSRARSDQSASALPEQKVLDRALAAWLDQLQSESVRRVDRHPLWRNVAEGYGHG